MTIIERYHKVNDRDRFQFSQNQNNYINLYKLFIFTLIGKSNQGICIFMSRALEIPIKIVANPITISK